MYWKRFCFVAAAAVGFAVVQVASALAAGDVTADFDGFALTIAGDQADNEIALYSDEDGTVWVAGREDTTINGGPGPVDFVPGPLLDVVIDMGDGDDAVDVRLDGATEVVGIDTGQGDDEVVVKGGYFGLIVYTHGGDDEVLVEGVVGGDVVVDTGDGTDEVVLRNTDTTGILCRTRVETGSGHDTIVLDSILTWELSVHAWEGNDVLELRGNSMLTGWYGSIGLGDGNDLLDADGLEGASFVLDGPLNVLGQKGRDTLINRAYFQPVEGSPPWWLQIFGFEVEE